MIRSNFLKRTPLSDGDLPATAPSPESSITAQMADMVSPTCEAEPESHMSSIERSDSIDDLPLRPVQNGAKAMRHSKKLSLNFPILVPSTQSRNSLESPRMLTPIESPRLSPVHASTAPAAAVNTQPQSPQKPTVESADFLTLLATQERKVLELREELQRAEDELVKLKRTWAGYEAGRKKMEGRRRISGGAGRNRINSTTEGATELRESAPVVGLERRRTLVEQRSTGYTHPSGNGQAVHALGRKNGQRVFSGSRHARTLSLLATTAPPKKSGNVVRSSLDETTSTHVQTGSQEAEEIRDSFDETLLTARPLLSRTSTLPELGGNLGGFGKTYKDLAGAGRRSLPPVPPSAEVFVRHGQRLAEGMKEGLWNFFEDIRQATVGEEGVSGVQQNGRTKAGPGTQRNRVASGANKRRASFKKVPINGAEEGKTKETSFWGEFGVESPRKNTTNEPTKKQQQQQSKGAFTLNAPSKNQLLESNSNRVGMSKPPDLLGDLEDDEWEAWESPTLPHDESIEGNAQSPKAVSPKPKQGEGMPWPEIQRATPSKLARSVSGLMREWEGEGRNAAVDEAHALASLHS